MKNILASIVLLAVVGCAGFRPLINPALGVAACATVQQYPGAAPFVAAAGDAFTVAGKSAAPTPTDMAKVLANLPNSDMNALYAAAIWQAAVVAYDAMYAAAKTPEQQVTLQATLTGIGAALTQAAASCGPATPPMLTVMRQKPNAPAPAVKALADAIEKQFIH